MPKRMKFETAIEKLEDLVLKLENGELELDKSIDYFTKGMELVKICREELDKAEDKVKILIDGKEKTMNFEDEDNEF